MRVGWILGIVAVFAACDRADVRSPCDSVDPVLADSSFVLVTNPLPGARVGSPFSVQGCSRTFESNIVWELRARNGDVLESGHASGGGVSGVREFSFSVSFVRTASEVGHLEVFAPDASEGEGFPGGRTVLPLVLESTPQ